MEKSFVIFLPCVVLLLVQCHMFTTAALNITSDQSALLSLKAHITYDPHTVLTKNWSTSTSICSWFGVTCGSRHRRITALNLSYMGLVGTIPPQMGNLSFLVSLSIKKKNSFYGSLPDELVRLRRLQHLSLGFNNFIGEIPPWMGQLFKLQNLHLFYNNFVGNIPQSLSNISSLQEIDLGCNQLSGSIPSPILNMPSLRVIILPSNKLSGELPVDVFNHLPNLQCLNLSYNQFHGKLPSNLFKCKRLQVLWLHSNNFTGRIPFEIGNLALLSRLDLSLNNFEDNLPSTIFKCRKLQNLHLQYNHFTGRVPSEIGNLTILTSLSLLMNYFEGAIPIEINNLQKLEFFGVALNRFTGPIPTEIFNISTMQQITMAINNFSGHLPSNIGLFVPNLQYLYLEDNKLSGTIPNSISNASQLIGIDLGENAFFGLIPTLGNLRLLQKLRLGDNNLTIESSPTKSSFIFPFSSNFPNLRHLGLSYNPLNIILPTSIGNLSNSLQELVIVKCNIKGKIPKDISNLTKLMDLRLAMNELIGTIPTTIERLYDIQGFYIQNNALEGPIPSNLCHLKSLDSLDLSANELSGPIPSCINNLTSLRHLFLDFNQITSVIPQSFWSLTYILEVQLSSNALSGTLSMEIRNLKVLIELNLSRNQLSGDIPQVIDNCKDMKYLSLANNQLEGSIPDSIGKMVSLEFLDLSNNNLSGEIPKSLEALVYLKYLNVSFNRLRGKIPIGGPFIHFPATSFISNDGLCGASKLQVLPCKGVSKSNKTIATQTLKYLLPTIRLAVVVVILVSMWKRHKNRDTKFEVERGLPHLPIWRRISYEELIQATNGFSANNFLGEGSFGLVYQGKLLDGKNVAIKVLDLKVEGALHVFSAECEILSNIRHRNLLKIISICSNMNFKALILEYMPNGSLESWLHSQNYYLNIFQRLNIMVDVASALEYLHYGYSMPIVHCDLKPSNVLLDKDMVAHVADFGIAKLLGDVNIMMQTMTLATIGYMAPEYGSGGIISTSSDVYSFGILLMETFTRKKPTNVMFTEEMSLKHWVEESLTTSVTKVLDSNLLSAERDHTSMEDCMSSIMELALSCCAELPNQRIDAKTISTTLKRVKSKFLQGAGAI